MSRSKLTALALILYSCTQTGTMDEKNAVTLWYDAFDRNDPALIDAVLSENWIDIPAAPGQPAGREGAKHILADLRTTFPDLRIRIEDIIRDGNKVCVRSTISGTQKGAVLGIPSGNRTLTIMAIDIHEFHDGRIVRTWHTEDWMTGLRQLGLLEK